MPILSTKGGASASGFGGIGGGAGGGVYVPVSFTISHGTAASQYGDSSTVSTNVTSVNNAHTTPILTSGSSATNSANMYIMTVPSDGQYNFTIRGASGSNNGSNYYGYGGQLDFSTNLVAGDVLYIMVGWRGNGENSTNWNGGGGGMTAILKNKAPNQLALNEATTSAILAVAGGGNGEHSDALSGLTEAQYRDTHDGGRGSSFHGNTYYSTMSDNSNSASVISGSSGKAPQEEWMDNSSFDQNFFRGGGGSGACVAAEGYHRNSENTGPAKSMRNGGGGGISDGGGGGYGGFGGGGPTRGWSSSGGGGGWIGGASNNTTSHVIYFDSAHFNSNHTCGGYNYANPSSCFSITDTRGGNNGPYAGYISCNNTV